jgi:putative DNA topoisomerase
VGCTQYPACQHIESLQESDDTQILCPECGKGHLVSRTSRYGKQFYSCDAYPHCKYVVNDKPVPMPCPECGWGIMIEKKVRGNLRGSAPKRNAPTRLSGYNLAARDQAGGLLVSVRL